MDDRQNVPVIVTFDEIERILTGTEAVGNLTEAADSDSDVPAAERAAIMAGMGQILNELRRAQDQAGARVLTTAQHGPASRLQSLIASGDQANLLLEPLPAGGLEAKFDTGDWFGWATVAWQKLKHPNPHPMLRPATAIAQPFPDQARVGVLGDWGTGLYGAPRIADAIAGDPDPFALLLHLGDVYYSGTGTEVEQRFLALWPTRSDAISRALNSNHEMYSGGEAYFGKILPRFGQESSYFALQNRDWTLVGLDVAYKDHDIDDDQVSWLEQILAGAGDRKVIFFSHHQLYSHWEKQGTRLWNHPGFGRILRSKRVFAWYWGHEHRCSIFEHPDRNFGLLGRCIGHSGMPEARGPIARLPRAGESLFDRALWKRADQVAIGGNRLSSVVVLDGPNEFIRGEEKKFLPHGYAVLAFDGPRLVEQVRDPEGTVIYENTLAE